MEGKLWKVTLSWVQREDTDPTNGDLETLIEDASYYISTMEVEAEELTAKRVYTCSHCGMKGHSVKTCPDLVGKGAK
jgi:hypothetical protein